jgi:hypothetical protein
MCLCLSSGNLGRLGLIIQGPLHVLRVGLLAGLANHGAGSGVGMICDVKMGSFSFMSHLFCNRSIDSLEHLDVPWVIGL